jgi:hypothetical protein
VNSADVLAPEGRKRRQSSLNRLADDQGGVVGLAQLFELGFTRKEIRTRVARGELTPLHRGVFIVSRAWIPARGHLTGALLAMGDTAALSHRTAGHVYGWRPFNRREIELTLPGKPRKREGLVIHRTTAFHPDDVRIYSGYRVTSVSRLLIDSAKRESKEELRRIVTASVQDGLFDLVQVEAALDRGFQRPWITTVRQALAEYVWTPRDKSTYERDFAALLATDPSIPAPARNVYMGPYEIDYYWAAQRLAVELDGRRWHIAIQNTDRDHAKDIWLQKRGIRCMRITDFRFAHERAAILADLHDFLDLQLAA